MAYKSYKKQCEDLKDRLRYVRSWLRIHVKQESKYSTHPEFSHTSCWSDVQNLYKEIDIGDSDDVFVDLS